MTACAPTTPSARADRMSITGRIAIASCATSFTAASCSRGLRLSSPAAPSTSRTPCWSRSGRVALDRLLVSQLCLVRVATGVPLRPSLPQQIPALVEGDADRSQPLTVRFGCLRVRLALEQLVFFAGELVDLLENLCVIHGHIPPG